ARILRAIADVEALPRIEPISLDEHHAQSRQRLPAPANRRAGAVRTIKDFDRDAKPLLHAGVSGLDLLGGDRFLRDLRLPAEAEQPPYLALIAAQDFSTRFEHADLTRRKTPLAGEDAVA